MMSTPCLVNTIPPFVRNDGSHSRLKTGTKIERKASGTQRWASESLGHRPMRVCDGVLESTGKDAGGIKTQEKRRKRRRKRRVAKSLEQIAKEILGVNGKLILMDWVVAQIGLKLALVSLPLAGLRNP